MADNSTENTTGSALAAIGKRLVKAREDAGKDLGDVASELHLRVEIIQALEAGDEDKLPAAAFVRGYVRSYARYVGLDDVVLIAGLPQAVEHRPVPRQSLRKPYGAPSFPLGRILVWGVILLVLAVLVLYGAPVMEHLWSDRDSSPLIDNALLLPPTDSETSDTGTLLLPVEESNASSGLAVIPAQVEEIVVAAVPETAETTGPAELTLRFTQDSWVEMTSRERKLVVGTQRAGTERTVSAEPPIDILLGNAPGVKIFWRGKPFDITPYQRGKVARIKLER